MPQLLSIKPTINDDAVVHDAVKEQGIMGVVFTSVCNKILSNVTKAEIMIRQSIN